MNVQVLQAYRLDGAALTADLEADMGRLMLKAERRRGHRGKLPSMANNKPKEVKILEARQIKDLIKNRYSYRWGYASIARSVGMSEATVRKYVSDMKKAGEL